MANYPYNSYTGVPNGYGYPAPAYQMPQAPSFQPNNQAPMVQMPNPAPANRPSYICYPVGSIEEAVASRVEAFDPPHIMLDFSHDLIYYKKFNQQTGGSDFAVFKRAPNEQQKDISTATPSAYESIIQSFSERLDNVDTKLSNLLDILDKAKTIRASSTKGAAKE